MYVVHTWVSVRAQASCHRRASASKCFNLPMSASKSGHPCRRKKKEKAVMSLIAMLLSNLKLAKPDNCGHLYSEATNATSIIVVGGWVGGCPLGYTHGFAYCNRLVKTVGKNNL